MHCHKETDPAIELNWTVEARSAAIEERRVVDAALHCVVFLSQY